MPVAPWYQNQTKTPQQNKTEADSPGGHGWKDFSEKY